MFYWQCRCVKPTRYDHMKPIHTHFPLHVVLCIGQVCRRVIHRPLFASPHLQQDNILVVSVHSNCLQRQAGKTLMLPKKDYRKNCARVSEKFLESLHSTTLANLCVSLKQNPSLMVRLPHLRPRTTRSPASQVVLSTPRQRRAENDDQQDLTGVRQKTWSI